ncbi:MAG TPA: BTAD domain-containing putative transcriptional regulator [Micromonosporaceae bacterium]|nr:BTAD domain-containing putative transcriptional regulator [Micromonosporaceae bacterium]
MIYRILGDLEIGPPDAPLPLPSGHRLGVLAILLVNANRRVSTADLLRAVWGGTEVSDTQLHKSVSYLRGLLATIGRRNDLKTRSGYGYELRVKADDLDKLVFEQLVRDADAAAATGRTREEAELLRAALQLWRGPHALAGVPGEPVRREALDLEHRRKRAAVRLFDLELARGRHERVLGELQTVFGYHPTDRRLCEQVMLALYRRGHATQALAAYERHTDALAEETGGRPDAGLRNLRYAVASGDEAAVARYEDRVARQVGAVAPPVVVPRQLPAGLADLVGRDGPLAQVCQRLTRRPRTTPPVVVVTGPGGIGKTTLVVRVAHEVRAEFPDGQLYVDLRGTAADPAESIEVLAQLLRAFGVTELPQTRDERAGLCRSLLADRRVLLVLDDARDEEQVRDLVPGNPACAVLVTARQRLPGIDGAHHVPTLPPLDEQAATELFGRVVRHAGIDPGAEAEATRRVVALCAGLPLALRIAGALRARDPDRSTAELAKRLANQPLDTFVYGDRSVERSIGAGFDRLDPAARRLFLALGLLQLPDIALWTAAAVLDRADAEPADGEPADALLRLARCHMIQPVDGGIRYRLHDLTREYARRRGERDLPEPDRRAIPARAHAALLTLARRAHRAIYGGDVEVVHSTVPDHPVPPAVLADLDDAPLDWYEAERLNLRAAVRHTAELDLTGTCWDLAVSAHEFYSIRGYLDDWYATHMTALEACRRAGDERGEAVVTMILAQPSLVASRGADLPGPDELAWAARVLDRLGDGHGQAIALRALANCLRRRGQFEQALATFARAQRLYEACGDEVGAWQALRYVGQTHLDLGQHDEALRILRKAQESAGTAGWPRLLAQNAYWIGRAHLARGEVDEAERRFRYVLDTVGHVDATGRAYATHGLGDVARLTGDWNEADRHLATASELACQAGDNVLEGRVQLSLAALHRACGAPARTAAALTRAASLFEAHDAAYLRATALSALGQAHAELGRPDEARAAWTTAFGLYTEMGLPEADQVRDRLEGRRTEN